MTAPGSRKHATRWNPRFDLSTVPDEVLLAESARRLRARQVTPPRAKVLRQCPRCLQAFGARELRAHIPACKRNPRASTRTGWTLRRMTDAGDQDRQTYRYWRSQSPGDRIVATWELSEAAYSIKRVS